MSSKPHTGTVTWFDLTVKNADEIRDFYAEVVGWMPQPVDMKGYADWNMTLPGTGDPATGICHARGGNADLPAQWLIYVNVDDLDASLAAVKAGGGKVLAGPKGMGNSARYAVIQDPAGAVLALFDPGA